MSVKHFTQITRGGNKQRRALIAILTTAHAKELTRLARALRRDGRYEPIVLFGYVPSPGDSTVASLQADRMSALALEAKPPLQPRSGRAAAFFTLLLPLYFVSMSLLLACKVAEKILCSFGRPLKETRSILGFAFPNPHLQGLLLPIALAIRLLSELCNAVASLLRGKPAAGLGLFELAAEYFTLRRTRNLAREMLTHVRPDIIVMAESNPSFISELLTRAGHERHVPCVLVPYTVASVREFVESLATAPENSLASWPNRLVGKLYPHWRLEDKQQRLLRLPAHQVLAREWLGLSSSQPWLPNDGSWDALAVESGAMLERYLAMGLPARKLVLTGAVSDDLLAERLHSATKARNEFFRELGLHVDRGMILCAIPPNQLTARRPECEFTSYEELILFMVSALRNLTDYNLVVSLHPSAPGSIKKPLEALGVCVSARDTLELVPLCDLYVASVSATIRWAIACGIPVLNFDVYRYRYDDYAGVAGVILAESADEYSQAVDRLGRDRDYLMRVRTAQAACANAWGHTDGRSAQRLVELLDRLTSRARERPATTDANRPRTRAVA